MRGRVAFLGIAAALAACPGEPSRSAAEQPATRAPAARDAAAGAEPHAGPSGDRHARAATRRARVVKRARGRLARSDGRAVVVSRPNGSRLTLRVAPGTTVTLDGRPARAEALPPGADVRAAYRTGDGGRPTAIAIEAQAPAPAGPGAGAPAAGERETSPDPAAPGGG